MLVRYAKLNDIKYIEHLRKKETNSLGFLPTMAFESAITGQKKSNNRWSTTCNDKLWVIEENKDLVGYLLMSFGKWARVTQIAIQEDARMIERGKKILTEGVNYGITYGRFNFMCGCATDLQSNSFWSAVGWKKLGERNGKHHLNVWKSKSKRDINVYHYQQGGLFFNEQ
tara:strand:- start:9893 stop:10402 length:510 start_codon:yes stop_codon:yes gene_type:complete